MKSVSRLAIVALLASASSPALAGSATPEEAQRLAALIESYLGKTPGVAAVTVNGEGYDLVIDPSPFFRNMQAQGNSASMSPLRYNLKDQGGGKWLVTQDQSIEMSFAVPPVLQFKASASGYRSTGIFDEALGAFESGHTTVADVSFVEDVDVPDQGKTHVDAKISNLVADSAAALAPSGGIDGSLRVTAGALTENLDMPGTAGAMPPTHLVLSHEQMDETVEYKGLKWQELWPLVSWIRDHPSDSAMKAGHAEFAALLRKALPVFGSIKLDASMTYLKVGTALGDFGIKSARVGFVMNGAVSDGLFGESIAVEGLTMPPGIVPPFANDLVASSASIGFKITDFDLAAPAKILLDYLEKTSDDPSPETQAQLQAALMPKGEVRIALEPGSFVSKALTVDYQGSMAAGLGTKPSGEALVKAKGLDALIRMLQAAPAEMGLEQGIYGVLAAKGFGKAGADGGITWKVEMTREGAVSVNGVPMPGTGGAQ
jgi:hypothetical protein